MRPRRWCVITATAVLAVLSAAGPAHSDPVRLEAEATDAGARLTLTWPEPVTVDAEASGGRLYLHFDRAADGPFSIPSSLRLVVGSPATTDNGKTLVFPIARNVTALAIPSGNRIVVELALEGSAGAAAAAAGSDEAPRSGGEAGRASQPVVAPKVRVGQHKGFSRVVFEWPSPVDYTVDRTSGTATIVFPRPAKIDDRQLRTKRLKYVNAASVDRAGTQTRVTLQVEPGADVRDRQEGRKVVIDVYAPPPGYTPPPEPAPASSPQGSEARPEPASQPPPPTPPLPASPAPPPAPATAPAPTPTKAPEPAPSRAPSRKDGPAEQTAELRVPWDRPVAAAVFRRGAVVWCVFDQPSARDGAALARDAGAGIIRVDQRPAGRATILRLETSTGVQPTVTRDGFDWLVHLAAGTTFAGQSIAHAADVPDDGPSRVLLPVSEPGEPVAIYDPVSRETSVVVPVSQPGSRIERGYVFPQFVLPETAQGIVVEPAIDTLRVRSVRDGVEIGTPDGLAVSASIPETPQLAGERLLDPRAWKGPSVGGFPARRHALEQAVVNAPPGQREEPRLRLAQYLLGNRFAVEALGELQVSAQERPALVTEPSFLLLRGVSELLVGRTSEAREDIARAAAGGSAEAGAWAAAARVAAGDGPGDLSDLPKWTSLVRRYPADLQAPLALRLAEAAIDGDRPKDAARLIGIAKGASSDDETRGRLAYLEGRRREAAGNPDGALAAWEEAGRLDPRRARAEADLARTKLLLREKRIKPEEAIANLQGLQFSWRGDEIEFRVRRELGRLQLESGNYPDALRTLKSAIDDFPGLPEAKDAAADMVEAFRHLFLDGAADRLPPVTAIALYDEFKELTPPGEAGRRMVRGLAERLASVDLLSRAAEMLDGSLASIDDPAERAEVGARVAELRLQDRDTTAAIDALKRTSTAVVPLPPELQRRRALLEARALTAAGHGDRAMVVLGQDSSLDADLLRARILREQDDWPAVAVTMRRIVDAARASQADGTLDDAQARDVLDLAVALTLAGNDPQLSQLDREYREAMAQTPLKDAFRLLAGTVPPPDPDPQALADLVERAASFRRSLPPAEPKAAPPAGSTP